ncbi:putative ribonuclease H protein [Glycine max]|nr:putative ribonuclease H protein [Glycine max]
MLYKLLVNLRSGVFMLQIDAFTKISTAAYLRHKFCSICSMWVEKGWEWKFKWRRHLFDRELEMADCFRNDVAGSCIQIHKKDDWIWKIDPTGQYSNTSIMMGIYDMGQHSWSFSAETVHAFCLPSRIRLNRRRSRWLALTWTVWQHRNKIIFSNQTFDGNKLMEDAIFTLWTWLKNFDKDFAFTYSYWSSNIASGFYADDTVFVGEAEWENVIVLKAMLRGFELASGLKINYAKSQFGIIGGRVNWVNHAAQILKCRQLQTPFCYLGIPIGAKPSSNMVWEPLTSKYESKLSKWAQKNISMAGKVTLINSVLNALPIYLLSFFKIPQKIGNTAKKFSVGGGGGGDKDYKKIPWVKWETICLPKEEGGLGIKEISKFNEALLGKWIWDLASDQQQLWARIIKSKYGGWEELQSGRDRRGCSHCTRGALYYLFIQYYLVMKSILRIFELVSGLKINYAKSQFGCLGKSLDWCREAANYLNCGQLEFPFSYLGIPVGSTSKSWEVWQPLISKFESKVAKWKQRCLSMGGRIFLTALPIYLLSFFKIPKKVVHKVVSIPHLVLVKWNGDRLPSTDFCSAKKNNHASIFENLKYE